VTEEITGVDLVQCQIKIAGGASLADLGFASQADVPPVQGFAIQCRVTCEDPGENFKPDSGRLEAYRCALSRGPRARAAPARGARATTHVHLPALRFQRSLLSCSSPRLTLARPRV